MMPANLEVRAFDDDLLPAAAELLAQRLARLHAADPVLPTRLARPEAALESLRDLWREPRAAGAAALEDGRLVAYLIGVPKLDAQWGRSVWVRGPGLAIREGAEGRLLADLYAEVGEAWVRDGIFNHFALVPAAEPEVVQAWFALSFGIEQVHAVVDLRTVEGAPAPPAAITIRRAGPGDADTLAGFSDLIWRELVRAPVWGLTLPEAVAEIRNGYAELAADPTATVWIAEREGQALGIQGYWEHDNPDPVLVPEKAVTVSVLSTRPEARRQGIQSALTRHGLMQARAAGYLWCETDWRSANRAVARMLPRYGFRPIAYRLARRVDARIAWAPGRDGRSTRA